MRGRQCGELAGDRVRACCDLFRGIMAKGGWPWPKVKERAGAFASRIKSYCADYLEELDGIAEAAGVSREALILLNARNELMCERNTKTLNTCDECTSVVCLPATTVDGHLLHAQNWDYRQDCAELCIMLRVVPENGPSLLTFTIAGGLARCGLNSAGIAVTGNGLASDRDHGRTGVPLALIRRRVLESSSYADALTAVTSPAVAASNNMTVSSAEGDGDAINFECAPGEVFWLVPEDGLVVHANHFKSPAARAKLRDVGVAKSPWGLYRDRRVEALLRPQAGHIDRQAVMAALDDRFGSPHAVCRSPIARPDGSVSMTVASLVMDVTAGRMWVRMSPWNNPTTTEYALD
ncbi:MAG: C45 family autoproteolytic acyltransferase/hydrolase [Planctomycetota bacterium]